MARDIGVDANINKIRVKEIASPSTPASGYGYIYAKTDGLYFKGDNGTEIGPLGTGSSGGATLLVEANRTTNLSLTANTTAVDYNNITTNIGSAWSGGVFTAPSTGLYMFEYQTCMTSATAYVMSAYVDGTIKMNGNYSTPGDQRHQNVFIESLTSGQTLQMRCSATLTMDGSDSKLNWVRVVKLA